MQRWYHATRGHERYTLELAETRIQLSRDTGTPDAFGGNAMPYARFLRSSTWQQHVREIYGDTVLAAVLAAARAHGG
jgi:hypothetical protein